MNKKKEKVLLSLSLKAEGDVLVARRRARQIASLLGFGNQDQTRISTAVSEIVREAHFQSKKGKVEFCIADNKEPYTFKIVISDLGSDSPVMDGKVCHTGIYGAKKLMDSISIENSAQDGTIISLHKILPTKTIPFTEVEIDSFANALTKLVNTSALDEVHQQNQDLLAAMDEVHQHQKLLDQANSELLQLINKLSTANESIQNLNHSLEEKVVARTVELARARDEAIKANELKTQFIANISHEIRTPMSGILGLSELLAEETNGENQTTARYVHESASNLMKIVDDLLDMSKLEAGKLRIEIEKFEIAKVINDILIGFQITAKNKNLTLTLEIEPELLTTYKGDAGSLRHVLQNLIQNAIKFTDAGTVQIVVQQAQKHGNNTFLKFSVIDTGMGISEKDQKKLFQLFVQLDGTTTRKHGGTGLGLALCKNFVELMGGALGVNSTVGKGSVFWFVVPLEVCTNG